MVFFVNYRTKRVSQKGYDTLETNHKNKGFNNMLKEKHTKHRVTSTQKYK